MSHVFNRRRLGTAGATSLEFGVVAFIFMSLLFGVLDLGRYYVIEHSVRTATSEAARAALATAPPGLSTNRMVGCTTAWAAVKSIVPLLDDSAMTLCIAWTTTSPTGTVTNGVGVPGVTTVTATGQYSFTAISPLWSGLTGTITETAKLSY